LGRLCYSDFKNKLKKVWLLKILFVYLGIIIKTKEVMEKEFINYSEALALKELGFDEPCMYIFDKQRNNLMCPIYGLFENEEPNRFLNAPLYQQAFRWFREKYGIKTYVYEVLEERFVFITYTNQLDYKMSATYHPTYEEAELECLKKLIEIVKQK
jgi:hypothetical protein